MKFLSIFILSLSLGVKADTHFRLVECTNLMSTQGKVGATSNEAYITLVRHLAKEKNVISVESLKIMLDQVSPPSPLDYATNMKLEDQYAFAKAFSKIHNDIDWSLVKEDLKQLLKGKELQEEDQAATKQATSFSPVAIVLEKRSSSDFVLYDKDGTPLFKNDFPEGMKQAFLSPDGSIYYTLNSNPDEDLTISNFTSGKTITVPVKREDLHRDFVISSFNLRYFYGDDGRLKTTIDLPANTSKVLVVDALSGQYESVDLSNPPLLSVSVGNSENRKVHISSTGRIFVIEGIHSELHVHEFQNPSLKPSANLIKREITLPYPTQTRNIFEDSHANLYLFAAYEGSATIVNLQTGFQKDFSNVNVEKSWGLGNVIENAKGTAYLPTWTQPFTAKQLNRPLGGTIFNLTEMKSDNLQIPEGALQKVSSTAPLDVKTKTLKLKNSSAYAITTLINRDSEIFFFRVYSLDSPHYFDVPLQNLHLRHLLALRANANGSIEGYFDSSDGQLRVQLYGPLNSEGGP